MRQGSLSLSGARNTDLSTSAPVGQADGGVDARLGTEGGERDAVRLESLLVVTQAELYGHQQAG